MKKVLIFSVFAIILFNGCSEIFEPKAPFEQKFLVYSVIKGDSTKHVLMIAHTYDVDGFNPSINTTPPELAGADVRIVHEGIEYILRDTLIDRDADSRYQGKAPAYVVDGFRPGVHDTLSLKVKLPNGKEFTAMTGVPQRLFLEKSIFAIGRDRESTLSGFFVISWQTAVSYLFVPKLELVYTKDGEPGQKRVEIPYTYTTLNGVRTPLYPGPGKNRFAAYEYDAIDSLLSSISSNESNKRQYRILRADFSVMVMDINFSKYYSSVNGYLDPYSVRLDEKIFTNIEGGAFGVFGSFMITSDFVSFDEDYILNFGYRTRF
ncbi:MAG: DUF4249 family protein [Ignavibacteriaceae bacterium]|nr:DUF4249 family protein [Ignavibacteriaceae bacterium]